MIGRKKIITLKFGLAFISQTRPCEAFTFTATQVLIINATQNRPRGSSYLNSDNLCMIIYRGLKCITKAQEKQFLYFNVLIFLVS